MVLRTSVTYNTQKATLPLTDDQRHKADELSREAQQSNQAGKYGDAMRSLYQGLAVMRNVPWTPAFEFATVAAGQTRPRHRRARRAGQRHAHAALRHAARCGRQAERFAGPGPRKEGGLRREPLGAPFDGRPGGHALHHPRRTARDAGRRLHDRGPPGRRWRRPGRERARSIPEEPCPCTSTPSPTACSACARRLAKAPKKDGLATAEYAMALYERADSGEINPARVNFREEFAAANAILDALDAGKDPFAGKHGDSHRAYRSAVDNTPAALPALHSRSHTMRPKPRRSGRATRHGRRREQPVRFVRERPSEARGRAHRLHRGLPERPRLRFHVPGHARNRMCST